MSIPIDIKIDFLEILIRSFSSLHNFTTGEQRQNWIRNNFGASFGDNLEGLFELYFDSIQSRENAIEISTQLIQQKGIQLKQKEIELKQREIELKQKEIELKQKENENQQERNRIDSLKLIERRKSASQLTVSEINDMNAKKIDFYTSSTSKTANSLRSSLNRALRELINQSGSGVLPEKEVREVMDPFFIDAATALGLPCTHWTEFDFGGERTYGNIDHVYCFGDTNIPVFLLEFKSTQKSISFRIVQILAEVEAIFQNLRCILGNDAVELVGILTNGFEWIGVRSYFRDEQLILEYSTLISALTPHTTVQSIDTTGVNSILRLLSYCFDKVKNLINSIENFNNRNKKRIFNDDEPPVSRDDEEDPEDPEDPENKSRKRSLRKPSSSTSLKKSKGNHSSKTSGQKSNKNQETEDFGTLSEWNIITHTRNPENVNEYRSLERFLGLEKVF